MKEKKTVGFDILDNVGLDKIDRIGTDMDMLDEKTKKRILEMTKKRFNDAIKGENTGIEKIVTDENAEVVENVEVYNRSKIRKIMTGVVNTAAVVGLAAGSVFLVKNIGRGDIDKPVEPDLPAVSTTEPANQTQEEIARNKRLEYEVQATFECYEKNIVGLSVDDLKIDYAYLDINNDSVDELFIHSKVLDIPESVSTTIYFFNGTEYIAFYRIVADEFKFDLQNRKYYEILKENDDDTDYCLLRILTWENVEFSDGDQDYLTYFTPQDNYEGGQFYLHDNNRCTKEEYESAWAEYENCNSAELNFIPYTVKRESAEETARNQRIEASYEPEGQVIEQSIEAGEKVEKGTEITLTFSNGKKPDGEVPITFDLPAEANGRFVIAFMVQKEDGTPENQESATFCCPEYCQLTQNIIGSGKNVNVTAIITNLSNNKRATIGTYSFNFAEGRYTCLSGGDPYTAFEAIGAFLEPETESPPLPKYGDEEPPVEDSTTTTE
ncbi:MAG: PASTA domain-containing protein [Ruminococcus sp.]|nr:PASTA domain-containing protein [Ruminococcus sp.]